MRRFAVTLSVAALSVVAAAACTGRPRSTGSTGPLSGPGVGKAVAEFDLSSGVPESLSGGLFEPPVARTYVSLTRSIERALAEPDVAGAFVKLGMPSLGWAQAEELGELFDKLKRAGKPVVCHAHVLDNAATAFTLRGCTRTWLSPAGEADTVGIAAQVMYFRGLFDRLKIGVDFLHVGEFKSGVEPFTREGPSDAARQSLTETLSQIRLAWLDQARKAGKPDSVLLALEQGPFGASDALAQGIVERVGFESEALNDAKSAAKAQRMSAVFGPKSRGNDGLDIAEILRVITGGSESATSRPHVAVLPAEGAIAMESGGAFDSGGITARAFTRTLRRLREDAAVKAVVLRIDSPGGSALASDLLWHELRQLKQKKPLVVSVGGMAASGGYYLACAAERILAEPTSIVGSIGVFGGKIVLSPALSQVGVNVETFPASPEPGAAARAAAASPFSAWDDATRERIRAEMQGIYALFVARVAESRKLPREKVEESAEGRIWSGREGLERGLVDQLGGLSDAVRVARKLAQLPDDSPVTIEGGQDSLLEMLMLGEDATEEQVLRALSALRDRSLVMREVPAALQPYASALGPLASGERIVAALPFGIAVE